MSHTPEGARARVYLATRDSAWSTYRNICAAADRELRAGNITAAKFLEIRDAAHTQLDDAMEAARRTAGYVS